MRLGVSSADQTSLLAAFRELSGDDSVEVCVKVTTAAPSKECAEVVLFADASDSANAVARLSPTLAGARLMLRRLIDALTRVPGSTPSCDEYWLSIAGAASWRSSSTQMTVGAALVRDDTMLAVGTNEVPLAGGVFNWSGDVDDSRDYRTLIAGAPTRRQRVIDALIAENGWSVPRDGAAMSQILAVIDVERAVHAEVAAVLSAARTGATTLGATLYTTHSPCYRCARFLAAAGVARVLYDKDSNTKLSEPLELELRADLEVTQFTGIRWELLRYAIGAPLGTDSGRQT